MALEEQLKQKKQVPEMGQGNTLTEAEHKDLEIAVMIGQNMMDDGGFDVIEQAIEQSSDPAQVIGQFLVQLIQKLAEAFPEDMKLSPRIYLAKNGFVEQMMDILIDEFDLDIKTADRAEIYVAQMAQELAKSLSQQQAPHGQPSGQPPLPQGGSY